MNSTAFGPQCWNFLHQLPWLFPREILSPDDSIYVLRFCAAIVRMLPCRYCRNSGMLFESEFGIVNSLSYRVDDVRIVTRSKIASYWYNFHNRVNIKLEKPTFGDSWRDSIKPRPGWKTSFWAFIFATCWNYPETEPEDDMVSKYYTFFSELLPQVLKYSDLGKEYIKYTREYPLKKSTLTNRLLLCKWIYNIRCLCNGSCGPEVWNYQDTDTLMEAFRARTPKCNTNEPSSRQEALSKHTCQ